jgi:hypothetical protein
MRETVQAPAPAPLPTGAQLSHSILAAGVEVDVRLSAHHRPWPLHRRDPIGSRSAPSASATPVASAGGAGAADDHAQLVRLAARQRVPGWSERSTTSSPGRATAPCYGGRRSPPCATWTAQSVRSSPYSRVPSTGSTIHTRSLARRSGVVLFLFREQPIVAGAVRASAWTRNWFAVWSPGLAERLAPEYARGADLEGGSCPQSRQDARQGRVSVSRAFMFDHPQIIDCRVVGRSAAVAAKPHVTRTSTPVRGNSRARILVITSVEAMAPAAFGLPVNSQLSRKVSTLPRARQLIALSEGPAVAFASPEQDHRPCPSYFSGINWAMMYRAASSAVISAVLTRISGASGGS